MSTIDWSGLQFETVVEEAGLPIEFENVGDSFVGEYLGATEIDPTGNPEDAFTQHKFRDDQGRVRVVNGGYKLNVGLEVVGEGAIVRITRADDVPMSDAGKNPMKDYRIDVAKTGGKSSKATAES